MKKTVTKIEIHKGVAENGKPYYWVRYVSANGKIVNSSETFKNKASATKNIKAQAFISLQNNVVDKTK